MGASVFSQFQHGASRAKAFKVAVKEATLDYGRAGYTGTLAEKDQFVRCGSAATLKEAENMAENMIKDGDDRIDDKWGPAGCIDVDSPEGFLFFGWSPS